MSTAIIYLFKFKDKDSIKTAKRDEICLKLTIKTPVPLRSSIFIVDFEQIPHSVLVVLLLTLNK